MELTIYDIIKGPVISDKAYKLNRTLNQLVLHVHSQATKPMIKNALERLFNVKVSDVRTENRRYTKTRGTARRYTGHPKMVTAKVAYITLAEGYSLNLFDQAVSAAKEESKKIEKGAGA